MKAGLIGVVTLVVLLVWSVGVVAQTPPKDMVLIPAGEFEMGDAFNEGFLNDRPVHSVYVSAFFMDKYSVTKSLWDDVYSWATNHGYQFTNPGLGKALDHPIHSINWWDAVKWCNARSEKEGITPAYYTDSRREFVYRSYFIAYYSNYVDWTSGYRLPTDAQWEKAARGGLTGKRFPWGDTISHEQANFMGSYVHYDINPENDKSYHKLFNDEVKPYTSPVGFFAPNGYGLYDMAGNMANWCWDAYYPYTAEYQVDPLGPNDGVKRGIYRGGSWTQGEFCRTGLRQSDRTIIRGETIGLRCVFPVSGVITLIPQWRTVIEQQPEKPKYSPGPEKLPGKDSLIVVTHGWQPIWTKPQMDWVIEATNLITQHLKTKGLNNWQVHAHDWLGKAHTFLPGSALDTGEQEGHKLGTEITSNNWSHIHFVAHSAGSALIQQATRVVKTLAPKTTIHETFLDAYVGGIYGGKSKYGAGADWAEHYFSQDPETILTDKLLKNAHNVEVTWLDSAREKVTVAVSSDAFINNGLTCYQTVSSHGWPHDFYIKTMTRSPGFDGEGFGFQLSKEGGNWDPAKYKVGNSQPVVLGKQEVSCVENYNLLDLYKSPVNFPTSSPVMSDTGKVIIHGIDAITLNTGSPVWATFSFEVTNLVNFVSFRAEFLSKQKTEGLLSVFWDTNKIGAIDETSTTPGFQEYTMPLLETVQKGIHTLGFRLDTFATEQSSLSLTNTTFVFSGIRDPFSLSFKKQDGVGVQLQLAGPKGFTYRIDRSSDVVNWTPVAFLINKDGSVLFTDTSPRSSARFYRAVVP